MRKVITPSDAFATYERAFWAGSPGEVEDLLREMLNVQVAVVKDKNSAEEALRQGKRLKTISVSYSIFLNKFRSKVVKTVYQLEPSTHKNQDFLVEVKSEEKICPNHTYVLLAQEAGYSPEKGLTFEGDGQETGFESQPDAETREKTTTGRFQNWEDHAKGAWERSIRITKLYRPFVERWAKEVFNLDNEGLQSFVDSLEWAMQIAVYFHDIGKLNKKWQEIMWENELKIINNKSRNSYIARTSPLNSSTQKNELKKPPFHAPFAYPFLRFLLRGILGDYRFLDKLALAAARHHSLEVTGAIERNKFEWDEWDGAKADEWLQDQIRTLLDFSEKEAEGMEKILDEASRKIAEESEADEPPGPTDDFYFLYCVTNRLVKICDWEDAGGIDIELR
ncbi:hypothetical protein O163_06710 [Caldanaerobacter subterraneus subsp. yonseiensis KB-1]|uniref:CRISPR-associated endonuclease Cas3 n=1 Tax=Caldanaerobacter subterraneus subsp. yonseiensis KB-1 TaxID=1388761 RepID=U5CVR2_CALSX|nr:CRISPR-associated endonuclease Cas3'' [Caldanaerobacter subterraneus]ERM92162.1 hypothetical protein O163_06710 [Caldanaerobacter subterraneus subsp. yonseiensis KB-1]